jgi:hypothetical protein
MINSRLRLAAALVFAGSIGFVVAETPVGLSAASSAVRSVDRAVWSAGELPSKLSDQEFWNLTEELSEANGYFRSDNFLSNEVGYQMVIPELVARVKPGGVYMGVAPEINFTYIAALKPRMAFVIDIRRGNLHEHLLYKSLFEISHDRVEFLSRLFSRKRPAGVSASSSIADLFAAYDAVQPNEELFTSNVKAVMDHLTKTHHFKLRDEDPEGIEYVYRQAFFNGGPYLNYSFGSAGGMGGMNSPTYEQLMTQSTDTNGENRSFLSNEERFAYIKDFETRNLLVPIVGDFAGPKAIRGVGEYVKQHGGTVVAFYLSNVEQYLQGDLWRRFCASVATLPLDESSTYIFSGRGAPGSLYGGGYGRGGGMGNSRTRPMQSEVASCAGQ